MRLWSCSVSTGDLTGEYLAKSAIFTGVSTPGVSTRKAEEVQAPLEYHPGSGSGSGSPPTVKPGFPCPPVVRSYPPIRPAQWASRGTHQTRLGALAHGLPA